MNFLSRLAMLLTMFAGFAVPAGAAATAMDPGGHCGMIAADDGDKKPGSTTAVNETEKPYF